MILHGKNEFTIEIIEYLIVINLQCLAYLMNLLRRKQKSVIEKKSESWSQRENNLMFY